MNKPTQALTLDAGDVRELSSVLSGLGVPHSAELVKALGIGDAQGNVKGLSSLNSGDRQQICDFLCDSWNKDHIEPGSALAFQSSQGTDVAVSDRLRLGNVMLATGRVTPSQLAEALVQQSHYKEGTRLGDTLVGAGLVSRRQVKEALQLQRKLVAAVMIYALALTASMGTSTARAANKMASMQVSAVIRPSAHLSIDFQADQLHIDAADVARGYVDVPGASRFVVVTPKGGDYLVDFYPLSDLFNAVLIDGLGSQVSLGSEGGTVAQTGIGLLGVHSILSYRFQIKSDVVPGVYEWPLLLAVRPR